MPWAGLFVTDRRRRQCGRKLRIGFTRRREGAKRLGLVKLRQMLAALVHAVENPASGIRIIEVPQIRRADRTVGY